MAEEKAQGEGTAAAVPGPDAPAAANEAEDRLNLAAVARFPRSARAGAAGAFARTRSKPLWYVCATRSW